ncbi:MULTISPECIES: class I SAM-dependent methyltransferase [unclassified Dysgonomonas]|uniref:class I SAM-dependent methyltransferase n=1 Tax=unclassified Dysgonomonas TaxID=2630389 RepID=UPI0013ED0277|nr:MULTISPECIES: class I SAM-dependent methyltransferase [unclassified Dysgonomonas]
MKKYLNNDFDQNKLIDVFDELPLWSAPFGLKLLDHINYKSNISALDIGFGAGFPLTEIAMRLGNNSTVYGIDPWKEAIERTHKKLDYYGITNVKIIEGVAENIPLDSNSIDLITSNNGINNVEDIEQVIAECSRIMKRGGQFIQTMNLDKSMFEFYTELEKIFSELGMNDEINRLHKHIALKRPPIDKFLKILSKNGFIVKDLEHDQFNYQFTDGTAMLNHYFIRLAFIDSWIKLIPTDRVELVFDMIESRLNEQAKILGGIKLSIPYVMINAIKQ